MTLRNKGGFAQRTLWPAVAAIMAGLMMADPLSHTCALALDVDGQAVTQGAEDVMASDDAPTTKEEAGEQLDAATQETQTAYEELDTATTEEANAQQAVDDELAREAAAMQDATDKNQAVADTKKSTEDDLDDHIEAGDPAFSSGRVTSDAEYDQRMAAATTMEDIYSDEDGALVDEAETLRQNVTQQRQAEQEKITTAQADADASRARRRDIQSDDAVSLEETNNQTFATALQLATGANLFSLPLDLGNTTLVTLYEQYLDLALRIGQKDATLQVFAGEQEGVIEDADAATKRYKVISSHYSDAQAANTAYEGYKDRYVNIHVPQLVAGDSIAATQLLLNAGLTNDSWQVRYIQETGTLSDIVARLTRSESTVRAYSTMLGGDISWDASEYNWVLDKSLVPYFPTYMTLNTYQDPNDPTYTQHGMVDQADALLNEAEWRSDKLAREFLGSDGAYAAWDQAGRPDLGEAFDAFVLTKYAAAHDVVATNVEFTRATPNLSTMNPNLSNNHLASLGAAYAAAGTANDVAAQNDGAAPEKATLAQIQQARQRAQDKYYMALVRQTSAKAAYERWVYVQEHAGPVTPLQAGDGGQSATGNAVVAGVDDASSTPATRPPRVTTRVVAKDPVSTMPTTGEQETQPAKASEAMADDEVADITTPSANRLPATGDHRLGSLVEAFSVAGILSLLLAAIRRLRSAD